MFNFKRMQRKEIGKGPVKTMADLKFSQHEFMLMQMLDTIMLSIDSEKAQLANQEFILGLMNEHNFVFEAPQEESDS